MFSLIFPVLSLSGCTINIPGKDAGGGGATDSGPAADDTSSPEDTGEEDVYGLDGTVTGHVTLQLYTVDENEDIVLMDFTEAYGYYPFGKVFVTAYETDRMSGELNYFAQDALTPATDGSLDSYVLTVREKEETQLHVYAVVDWIADGVIATYEPIGNYDEPITVTDGAAYPNADITVMVPYYGFGGGGCTTHSINGLATIARSWVDGNIATMLYSETGEGPSYTTWYTPTEITGGAEANFSVGFCESGNYKVKLLGAWDSNVNELIDPMDTWGSYVSGPDTDGNPLTIGGVDLSGKDIQIPFGDRGPSIVPFISLNGDVTLLDGLNSPPAGTKVYVGAFKRKPGDTVNAADLATLTYGSNTFDEAEMAAGVLHYSLPVPGNTIAYVWAFADIDGDGVLREVGEPVGTPVGQSGKVATGTKTQVGLGIQLGYSK